jgi:signal transduction histidine kinase
MDRALGADRAAVLLFDPDGVMRFKAWRGLSPAYRAAVQGHTPWSRDERAPEPIVVADVTQDASLAPFAALLEREGIRALAFIPLVAGGRLLGKFMVYYPAPRGVSTHEIELARAIANHVAASVARFAAVAELEQTVRFSEMFAGILGHDLRNPLAAIMNSAQLAMMRGDNEKLIKPLARILKSGDRMARMIAQLLDFTRVRLGGGLPLQPQTIDLLPLLDHVAGEVDEANPDWRIELTHQGDTVGSWDSDRLGQVFSNLIGNAVQHGVAAGGVKVHVDGHAPDRAVIEIRNQGAIPPSLLPRLFDPMIQGGRRERAHGLGLGLYISGQIVRAHGGTIEVSSSEEAGTRFIVTLPRESR